MKKPPCREAKPLHSRHPLAGPAGCYRPLKKPPSNRILEMSHFYYRAIPDPASLISRTRIAHGYGIQSNRIEATEDTIGRTMVLCRDGRGDDRHFPGGLRAVDHSSG